MKDTKYIYTGDIYERDQQRFNQRTVRGLIDFNDISYDDHAKLLYKLSSQVVNHLRSYLSEEDDVVNVLQYHQQALVKLIHAQMQKHFKESATSYQSHITKGFHTLRPNNYTANSDENIRNFRSTIPDGEKSRIKSMIFGHFKKCLYPEQKFESDSERRFAVLLENEAEVMKWFKPNKNDFRIQYSHDGADYEPDFVVETNDYKYLCEPKKADDMNDDIVILKAKAAAKWCEAATEHALSDGGKSWKYLLIPHDQITPQATLQGLVSGWTQEFRE